MTYIKWAIALMAVFVICSTAGAAILVGAFFGVLAGIGAGLLTLGVAAGLASKAVGDS